MVPHVGEQDDGSFPQNSLKINVLHMNCKKHCLAKTKQLHIDLQMMGIVFHRFVVFANDGHYLSRIHFKMFLW